MNPLRGYVVSNYAADGFALLRSEYFLNVKAGRKKIASEWEENLHAHITLSKRSWLENILVSLWKVNQSSLNPYYCWSKYFTIYHFQSTVTEIQSKGGLASKLFINPKITWMIKFFMEFNYQNSIVV